MDNRLIHFLIIGFSEVSLGRNRSVDMLGFMFHPSGNIYSDTVRKTGRRMTLGIL